jgi:exosortase
LTQLGRRVRRTLRDGWTQFSGWVRHNPWQFGLLVGIFGVLVYFFGFHKAYVNGEMSALRWAVEAWGFENNQEHSWVVGPIFFFLLWYHRDQLRSARLAPSNRGLLLVALGSLLFVVAARTLQPRLALISLPVLIYGIALYLWGREVARVFIFPCLFLLFTVPVGGLVQGTVSLQLLVSTSVKALSSLIGVKIEMIGTTLKALDDSFNFEIAEGCSGIRSLMAMTMLAALYVHFTQREVWKQLVIFAGSVLFALVGNIGRIFTVILFARFISPRIAGGIYHDYSGFIFFPIAVVAMVSFSRLLDRDWQRLIDETGQPKPAAPPKAGEEKKAPSPISYDY